MKKLNAVTGNARPSEEKHYKVKLTNKYNKGFMEFIIATVLPLVTSFSSISDPFISFFELIFIQSLMYFYYKISSDFFPNILFPIIFNYNVFMGIALNDNHDQVFCFAKEKKENI